MGKSELDADQVSRRSFLKGTLALGTAVSLFGCSVEDNSHWAEITATHLIYHQVINLEH